MPYPDIGLSCSVWGNINDENEPVVQVLFLSSVVAIHVSNEKGFMFVHCS